MKAKNTTPAPRSTPLQPNAPKVPVFSGTRGDHRPGSTWAAPTPTKARMIATLITTITALTRADSRLPRTRSSVSTAMMAAAGRSNHAVAPPGREVPGAAVRAGGRCRPASPRSERA